MRSTVWELSGLYCAQNRFSCKKRMICIKNKYAASFLITSFVVLCYSAYSKFWCEWDLNTFATEKAWIHLLLRIQKNRRNLHRRQRLSMARFYYGYGLYLKEATEKNMMLLFPLWMHVVWPVTRVVHSEKVLYFAISSCDCPFQMCSSICWH